jgi:predicted GIY-YIG superfamily endonuclease
MAIVYRHIRLDKNEVFYIGISKNNDRPYSKHRRSNFWKNIVNKTDYEVEILFDDLSWEDACEKEKEFIKLYGRKDLGLGPLVNMTDGGDGCNNYTFDDEIIKSRNIKIGLSNSTKRRTEEEKQHLREINLGKKLSKETCEKMSKSKKGIPNKYKGIPLLKVICPHCDKEGAGGSMKQWHFDNCKNKKK